MSGSSASQPSSSHGWEANGTLWNPVTMDSHMAVPEGAPQKTNRSRNRTHGRPSCQVPGCSESLLDCKPYFKRHLVCQTHAVAHMVTLNGVAMRFCQQCAKFERLTAFDQGNRSCRFRLFRRNLAKQRGNMAKQQQQQQQEQEQQGQQQEQQQEPQDQATPTEDDEAQVPQLQRQQQQRRPSQRQPGARNKSRPGRAAGSGQDTDAASSPRSGGSCGDLDTLRHPDDDPGADYRKGVACGEDWKKQAQGPLERSKRSKHGVAEAGGGVAVRGIGAAAALLAAATMVAPSAGVLAATEQLMAAAKRRMVAAGQSTLAERRTSVTPQDQSNLESRTVPVSDVRDYVDAHLAPFASGLRLDITPTDGESGVLQASQLAAVRATSAGLKSGGSPPGPTPLDVPMDEQRPDIVPIQHPPYKELKREDLEHLLQQQLMLPEGRLASKIAGSGDRVLQELLGASGLMQGGAAGAEVGTASLPPTPFIADASTAAAAPADASAPSSKLRSVSNLYDNGLSHGGGGLTPPLLPPSVGVPEVLKALGNRPGVSHSERSALESLLGVAPGPVCLPVQMDSSMLDAQLQEILQEVMRAGGADGFGWFNRPSMRVGESAAAPAGAAGSLGGSSLAAASEYLGLTVERRPASRAGSGLGLGTDQRSGYHGGGAGHYCLGAPPDIFGSTGADVGYHPPLSWASGSQLQRLLRGGGDGSGGGGDGSAGMRGAAELPQRQLQPPSQLYSQQLQHLQLQLHPQHERHRPLSQPHPQHHPHMQLQQQSLHPLHSYSAPVPEHPGASQAGGQVLLGSPAGLQASGNCGDSGAAATGLPSKLRAGFAVPHRLGLYSSFSSLARGSQQQTQQHLQQQQQQLTLAASSIDAAGGGGAPGAGGGGASGAGGGGASGAGGGMAGHRHVGQQAAADVASGAGLAGVSRAGHPTPAVELASQSVDPQLRAAWSAPAWGDLPQLSYESLRSGIRPTSGGLRAPAEILSYAHPPQQSQSQQPQPLQAHQHGGTITGAAAAGRTSAVKGELAGGSRDHYDGKYDTVRLSYKFSECDPYSLDPSTQGLLRMVASEGSRGVTSSLQASIRPGCVRMVFNTTVRTDQNPPFQARAPGVLTAVQELATVNASGVVLQVGEHEVITVDKTGAEVAHGSGGEQGSGCPGPGSPPVIARVSVAAVHLGARGSIQVYGSGLASPNVEFWGRMQGVHYQLQVQYVASDYVLVQLPVLWTCGLLVIEAASGPDAALLSDWIAVVVVPTERVAAEANLMQGRLAPASLRQLLVDLGSLLDVRPLLSQPVNGICPVIGHQVPQSSGGSKHTWRSSSFDQEVPCGAGAAGSSGLGTRVDGGPFDVCGVSGGGGGGYGCDRATEAGVLDLALSCSGTISTLDSSNGGAAQSKTTIASTGRASGAAGTTDVSFASASSDLSSATAITAAARTAAAELSLYLGANPGGLNSGGSGGQDTLGRLHSVQRLLGCFDPSELLTNGDDETVVQRLLGSEAARQLLSRAVTVVMFFAQRALVDTALCAVAALSDLHRTYPDLLTADLAPQPRCGEPCLMHAAVRSRSLALLLALSKCGDVLGDNVSLAWRGPGGITPLHLLALLGWPHLVTGLQIAVPSTRQLWATLQDDSGVSPAQIHQRNQAAAAAASRTPYAPLSLNPQQQRQCQGQQLRQLILTAGEGCAAATSMVLPGRVLASVMLPPPAPPPPPAVVGALAAAAATLLFGEGPVTGTTAA